MKDKTSRRPWILAVLVLILAMALWGSDSLIQQRQRRIILAGWKRRGAVLELDANGPGFLRRWSSSLARMVGGTSPKLIGLTDPKGVLEDSDLAKLLSFPEIEKIFLYDSKVSEVGLEQIGRSTLLTNLTLMRIPVTKAGFGELRNLKNLLFLELRGTGMGSDDLNNFSEIPELLSVSLNESGMTDEGLQLIEDWQNLRTVDVRDSRVTRAGIEKYKNARPEVRIRADQDLR